MRFQQRFDESFYEAWDRFNNLLRACPHHGFSELHQLDTFYNALNANDQDSLNSVAGGNFLDKMPRECLRIIESKSKVRNLRNKAVVAKVSSNSSTPGISPDVAALTTEVSELKNLMKTMLIDKQKAQAPATVKAVEQSCVTCGGAHSYKNCPATDGNVYQDNIQEYVSQAAAANFNQGNSNSRPPMVSNQIRPPGFPPIQNNQNRFNPNQGNNFNQNRGTNFNQNRGSQLKTKDTLQPPINQPPVYQAPTQQMQGVSKTDFENYVKANDAVLRNMQNQGQGLQNQMTNLTEMLSKFITSNTASSSNSGTLPSQTVTNPREHVNAITTRSGKTCERTFRSLVPTPVVSTPLKEPEQNPKTSIDKAKKTIQEPNSPEPKLQNQITHELYHLSNLLEINLQRAIEITNSSPPTSPHISPPTLDQLVDIVKSQVGYSGSGVGRIGLVVLSFNSSDDPIANLNKLMAFVSITFGPHFPQTNNQLRTLSNPRNQTTIQDGRVTVQIVQGRQTHGYANNGARNTATNPSVNRQGALCTKPKRPKKSAWFMEKMLLTESLESGAYLDPEQLGFLADNGDTIVPVQASQEIPTLAAFQTDDLDAFDSDCDDVPSANVVLMANLSSYDADVFLEVPFHDTNIENDMSYQSVQETQCSKQPFVYNDTKINITRDSNIISYEQYFQETKNLIVQNTSSSAQQDALLMSVIEEMSCQVAKCNKVQQENIVVNETLTAKLKRYKEQVKLLEQRQKFNLNDREKYIDGQLRQVVVDRNAKTHVALSVTDSEETLELAEESRLKMLAKQNEPSLKEKKVNITPVDYVALNKLSEYFVKNFMPQKQLSAEQAFWLPISQPVVVKPPVLPEPVLKKEIPHELPSIIKTKEIRALLNNDCSWSSPTFTMGQNERALPIRRSTIKADTRMPHWQSVYPKYDPMAQDYPPNDWKNGWQRLMPILIK
ncbi:hypothetical protein Tco_0377116 [Tanacetum coccineum]